MSSYVVHDLRSVGIGRLIGTPSTMGEGAPPDELSKPLRLKMTLTISVQIEYKLG